MKRLLLPLLLTALAALFLRAYALESVRLAGGSMEDTLWAGDVALVEKLSYRLHAPRAGDVVCVRLKSGELFVKRVAGVPGDTLEIRDDVLYRNGEAVAERYVLHPGGESLSEITLGEDQYCLLGDNRLRSHDSRSEDIGLFSRGDFVGRAVWVVWPLSHIGPIA